MVLRHDGPRADGRDACHGPAEYERLQRTGELDELIVPPPSERSWLAGRLWGTSAVLIGLTLVGLIIYAVVAHGL